MNRSKRYFLSSFLTVLALLPGPAFARSAGLPPALEDRPGGTWSGTPAVPPRNEAPALWSLRTGFRKGVLDLTLPGQVAAAPDVAVLKNGEFSAWPGLLAEFREASIWAEPDDIAGLGRDKPVLIIPSGGLAGLGTSTFVRGALAAYVRSGGVVLCMSQRQGSDFGILPSPDQASPVAGIGWSEDLGPLYRASLPQSIHPVLAAARSAVPAVETDGYLTAYPAGSTVLLARRDGFPTLLLYPLGKGWVVVSTFLSDVSHGQGMLPDEERTLLRDLVLWAKSGGRAALLQPGAQTAVRLPLRGAGQGAASAAEISLIGPERDKPLATRILPLDRALAPGGETTVHYAFDVPNGAAPGIYHPEYRLLDEQKRPLTIFAESGEGWIALSPPVPAPTLLPRTQPLPGAPIGISVTPRLERKGVELRLTLDIARTTGAPGPFDLIVRAADKQKYDILSGERTSVFFDLASAANTSQVSYAVSTADGRGLARGSADILPLRDGPLAIGRSVLSPGQTAQIALSPPGPGEITINGLGIMVTDIVRTERTFDLPVPENVPAGFYPLEWRFQPLTGAASEGSLEVFVDGIRVRCENSTWTPSSNGDSILGLRVRASEQTAVTVQVVLLDPAGKENLRISKPAQLVPGRNELSIPVPFNPRTAGIWQLRYDILSPRPGSADVSDLLTLSAGRMLLDGGPAAILSLAPDRPVYNEPAGTVTISAVVQALASARLELLVDGKRVRKEKTPPGTTTTSYEIKNLSAGPHRIKALVAADGIEGSRETAFLFGSRLPDLRVTMQTSELQAPAMEVGIGITNDGKTESPAATGTLYDGDPEKDGTKIGAFTVPPIRPGQQHVVILPWPLAGRAGSRTLVAVVEPPRDAPEISRENNRASFPVEVPEVLLRITPQKNAFAADEDITYRVSVSNFSVEPMPLVTVELEVQDPAGKTVLREPVAVTDIATGGTGEFTRGIGPGVPQEGTYLVSARATAGQKTASDSAGIDVLPTLAVKGTLDGTPDRAAPCMPLDIHYAVRNAGTIPVTGGSLRIEVRSKNLGQLVHAIQLPYTTEERTHRIKNIDFPQGDYRITLRASVVNQPSGKSTDLLLAERPVHVGNPITLSIANTIVPRILVWSGGGGASSIERALAEKMLHEAFPEDASYTKIVGSAEEFSREALSGLYNVHLLIDIDSTLDAADALRSVLARGTGVILAGANDRTRALAEQFGFRFGAVHASAYITFPAGSPLSLGGNIPFADTAFSPSRDDARVLAVYSSDQPAILAASVDAGRILVIPISLIRSALAAGTSTLYGLLVRSALTTALPEQEEGSSVSSVLMSVAATAGPVKARIAAALPDGARLLWTNQPHSIKNGTVLFDLTADQTPRNILYLFQGNKPNAKRSIDVQYECGGAFVSQGKVE